MTQRFYIKRERVGTAFHGKPVEPCFICQNPSIRFDPNEGGMPEVLFVHTMTVHEKRSIGRVGISVEDGCRAGLAEVESARQVEAAVAAMAAGGN